MERQLAGLPIFGLYGETLGRFIKIFGIARVKVPLLWEIMKLVNMEYEIS